MSKPINETGLPARIVLLAIRFTAANDLGDAISDKLDGDDSPTPTEITELEMASEQADRDYNESKALLFAAVRELTGAQTGNEQPNCTNCKGTGRNPAQPIYVCTVCGGTGNKQQGSGNV
jgi:DnaJ-class molecular chaperone